MKKHHVLILTILLFLIVLQVTFFLAFEYSVHLNPPGSVGISEEKGSWLKSSTTSSTSFQHIPRIFTTEQKGNNGIAKTSNIDSKRNSIPKNTIIRKTVNLRPEYLDDPEGPLLANIQELLLTVNLHSMLDIGYSISGRMSQLVGSKFDRVVVLATDTSLLDDLKKNNTHPKAEFVHGDVISFGNRSQEKFDVVFLNMVLQELPTHQVAPTLRSLESLLKDEGIGIVSTTHVEEGHGGLYLSTGDIVKVEEFDALASLPSGISRARRWTKSELMQELIGKSWEVTSHVFFQYRANAYARQYWEEQERFFNISFEEVCSVPVAQMVAVRRLATPYRIRFAAPLEPSSRSVTSVVFSLVRGASHHVDLDDLIASRKCLRAALHHNITSTSFDIDEVVFHQGNVMEHVQRSIAEELPGLRFVDIRHYGAFGGLGNGSGGGIYRWTPWVRLRRPHEYPVGYRHMCRFMAMLWMYALSKYDYAMRVDDDVCIHSMAHPFRFLSESHAVYAYGLVTTEGHEETVKTLTPWLDRFIKNYSIIPKKAPNVSRMYFTNFFATNVSWWLGNSVQLFLHEVDRSGNIYNHRWGDAPLQTATLDMFAAPDSVRWLHVDYTHMSTSNEILNGSEMPLWQTLTTSHTTTMSHEFAHSSEKSFTEDWNKYIAPCAVANHFNLTGAPFTSHQPALQALKRILKPRAEAENISVDEYSPGEIAYAVQVDIYGSQQPLPIESVQGSARRNAMFRVITGQDRQHPEYKDFTFVERARLSASPCFGIKVLFDRLERDLFLRGSFR